MPQSLYDKITPKPMRVNQNVLCVCNFGRCQNMQSPSWSQEHIGSLEVHLNCLHNNQYLSVTVIAYNYDV